MRILEVNKFYCPHVGGVERVVQDLAEGLSGRNHQVRVLACRSTRGHRRIRRLNGIAVIEAASMGTLWSMPLSVDFFILFFRLMRWADVVHWHEPFPPATLASLFLARRKLRVVTWHSDIVRQRLIRHFVSRIQRIALRRADLVITTSDRLAKFSTTVDLSVHRVLSIPIGIKLPDGDLRTPNCDKSRTRPRPFERYCLFVGRLIYYKGVDCLIEAVSQVPVPLVIVGQGPLRNWIVSEVERRGLRDRVHLCADVVSDLELQMYLQDCEFLVLPSCAASEAFGIVQVEAMAYGKPVINTDLPTGVPFVSPHYVSGLTVPPNDPPALAAAMGELWSNDALRRELGCRAHQRAHTEFALTTMIERYSQALQALQSSSAGARLRVAQHALEPSTGPKPIPTVGLPPKGKQ